MAAYLSELTGDRKFVTTGSSKTKKINQSINIVEYEQILKDAIM